MGTVGTFGFKEDERRLGESYLDYQRRVINTYERKNALPRMTLEMPLNAAQAFCAAVVKNIYPGSELDNDGNLTVIKKSATEIPKFIYVEVGGVRCRFRFTGEGQMNYENDVYEMNVKFVGFPD